MTMAALMHPHHPVDAFDRTPGPHRVSQECIHTPIGPLPLRTQALTQHLFDHDQLTETQAGVTLRLAYLVVHVPQARYSIAQHGLRDGRGQVVTQPIHMAQRPRLTPQTLDFAPTGAWLLLACRVEVGLRSLTALEATFCIKPGQSSGKLLDCLLGLPRLIAEPLCLTPGPPRNP